LNAEELARTKMGERSLVLIKPDGLMRGIVGRIIQRFEDAGLRIVGMKMLTPSREMLEQHFPQTREWMEGLGEKSLATYQEFNIDPVELLGTADAYEIGKMILAWNYNYLSSAPVIALALEGIHAIDVIRKMIGHTLPYQAVSGTIRGDFSINAPDLANIVGSACKNIVHASANVEEATNELRLWFSENEIVSWERPDEFFVFLKGANVTGE
jgi:nucleoside-diphosphate kinase